ncbi:AMP-binding protein [Rubellimicrobium rubrum]|uniref:AMP-binding protein n=1 Tax=Rubellimicrobium rubrum TaxID=2585369 RepID=UPI001FE2A3F1|nr:AMP-binding protein [Rubellimicrobium rubrum]
MSGGRSIYRLLGDNLPGHADRIALIDGDAGGRSITYAGLAEEVDRVAASLAGIGVLPGDRVIVHVRKGIPEVAAMLGASKIGAVVVNVNVQWTPEQLGYVASDCEAKALIIGREGLRPLSSWSRPATLQRLLVAGADEGLPPGFDAVARMGAGPAQGSEVKVSEGDLAMIIYTSGSTGMPKGVMLTHANICIGAETVIDYLHLGEDDRLLSVLPYSFDAGLNQLTTMLRVGGSVVHQPVAIPSELVRTVRDHAVTGFAGVPPLWNQVVRYLDETRATMPSLRRITNTGGKLPPNILELMPAVFPGVDIYLMYGLTEAFRSTFLPPEKFSQKMGSIGQAVPNAQVFVVKHGAGLAGPGEQGELVHAGPLVSLGYWQRPDLTTQKIRPCPELSDLIGDAPVVYSGDLVRVDEDGDLWFVGRMDDMIKTSGFRLSPTEVEDLVSRSGLAADIVAYGVEDDDLGQVVHVALTPLDGFSGAAMMAYCRRAMPHYMVPRRIQPWAGPMPRTASGKLDRPQVISRSKAGLTAIVGEDVRCP